MFRRFDQTIPKRESKAMIMKNIFIVDLYLFKCGRGCRGGGGGCENGRDDEEVREPILHRCLYCTTRCDRLDNSREGMEDNNTWSIH